MDLAGRPSARFATHQFRRRLLLVEDAVPALDGLGEGLASAGFEVDTARTAAEAMERLAGHRYAAIMTDCDLPDLSPGDRPAAMRGAAPVTPLVVYSGMVGIDELRSLARYWGAVAVLEKPFAPTQLVAAVREAIGP